MDFGISQLENTVTSISSAAQTLTDDPRFLPLRYLEPDYTGISVSVRNQMKDYLNGLIFPLSLVTDCGLQFSANTVITPNATYFGDQVNYYPERFCVDDLTYAEWESLLQKNRSGFLSVHCVATTSRTYDALIYSIPWTRASYLYACLGISDIKASLIAKENLSSYYLTITNNRGARLYTDLPEMMSDMRSITQKTAVGNLSITIHIPQIVLTDQMKPLYLFLGIYCSVCVLLLLITIVVGSQLSSRPLVNIINMLEKSNAVQEMSATVQRSSDTNKERLSPSLQYGFYYIQERVKHFESSLEEYRNTIYTQTKVLQARFLEKAIHGSLVTVRDKESFLSYFPDFPKSYCLVQLKISEHPEENGTIYPDSLYLIQSYLRHELPNAYQQQINENDLLLIISEKDFEHYRPVLHFLIDNINREEPSYCAWGLVSKIYHHIESLPTAYWQLQDMDSLISPDNQPQLYTVSDYLPATRPEFRMTDLMTMYTAITYGNHELALQKLQNYTDSLTTGNRSVYEMIRSVLLCIKQEYPAQLIDVDIPLYHATQDLYASLVKIILVFCKEIKIQSLTMPDPFVLALKEYIDAHFKEYDLCLGALEDHFNCSSSKIQKAFKKSMDVTVSDYIEKKRMDLANELLFRGDISSAEIAQECGFANTNSFYKAYRRLYGHSPTALKKM